MDNSNTPSWYNFLDSGLAFFLAIVGWVWHAARLATRVDNLEKRLEDHFEEIKNIVKENNRTHERLEDMIGDRHKNDGDRYEQG